jgi:hypothetical protein
MINFPFQEWFSFNNIVGGDWKFFWPENLKEILSYSSVWDSSLNTGIGKDSLSILWLNSYLAYFSHFLTQILNIPWNIAEKLIFFWPIILISFFSAFFLSRTFVKDILLNILSGVIYLLNTYALMIFSGGQVGVALAYAIAPFILSRFIKLIDKQASDFRSSLIAGLALSIQILFDPRIAILSMIMVFIYFLFNCRQLIKNIFIVFIFPFIVVVFLHMFWILPIIVSNINPIATAFGNSGVSSGFVKFLSFASFENAISLLHPNWPENIFGKIGFMKSEFILIPILAFSSLLFVRSRKILSFIFLGILGAFLAKGSNPPFGGIYAWLTDNVGLFVAYRDPTKWYIFITIAYSILIPLSLWSISKWISKKWKLSNVPVIVFVVYFLFLLQPLFLGQVKGTFIQHKMPQEYDQLRTFISEQPEFFRTLWIPSVQRFGFFSNNHPAISGEELLRSSDPNKIIQFISKNEVVLQDLGIKYIIVPFDSEGEIFLKNRKYDNKQYRDAVIKLEKISFLKETRVFDKITVFELIGSKDHFWINSQDSSSLTYFKIDPTEYRVNVENAKKGDSLVFSEGFSPNWNAELADYSLKSISFDGKLNSFILPKDGSYFLKISYLPAEWGKIGAYISFSSLAVILIFLFASRLKKP